MFVPGKPLQPSQMFAGKAGDYLSEAVVKSFKVQATGIDSVEKKFNNIGRGDSMFRILSSHFLGNKI